MKFLLVLAVFFVLSQAETTKEQLSKVLKLCVDEKDVEKYLALVKSTSLPVDDEEIGKVLVCYWRKLGIITDEDTLDDTKSSEVLGRLLKAFYPKNTKIEEIVKDGLKECKDKLADSKEPLTTKTIKARNCLFKYASDRSKE